MAEYEYCVMKNDNNIDCFYISEFEKATSFAIDIDADYILKVAYIDGKEIGTERVWENNLREKDVREHLNLPSPDFDKEWESWKNNIMKAVNNNRKLLKQFDYDYCLQSDFDKDEDFYNEIGYNINIIKNINGLIIFQKVKM